MCLTINKGKTADMVMSLLDNEGNLAHEEVICYKVIRVKPSRLALYRNIDIPPCGELYRSNREKRNIESWEGDKINYGIHVYLNLQETQESLERFLCNFALAIKSLEEQYAIIKCHCKIEDLVAVGKFYNSPWPPLTSCVFT